MPAPTSLKIDPALKRRVQHLAKKQKKTAHGVMLEAIAQYVASEEEKDSLLQEALDSWAKYQKDGLHLTLDEVGAWLDTWGTDKETAAPQCHV